MLLRLLSVSFVLICSIASAEWQSLFDGQSLDQWDGNPALWRVEDGAITGETTDETQLDSNSFIIWRGGYLDNFELKLRYKLTSGNSGIQYRSFEVGDAPRWTVGGYQADMEAGERFSGILYGERFRGILADRGTKTTLSRTSDQLERQVEQVNDSVTLQQQIDGEEWNDYHVIADGYRFRHYINGHLMSECIDNDVSQRRAVGLLALQIHTGPPMTVQFKDVQLKRLPATKRIVFIAGRKSHGFGAHEHRAGCMLLAKALDESGLPVQSNVVENGWPDDESVLQDADTVVVYADGGKGHPVLDHLDKLRVLQRRGVGLVCLHYGVEVPKGRGGDDFLKWIGGYFEANWSVNPHWTATFDALPKHPTTNGVSPFAINDEWYYHMRFPTEAAGFTPILSALPPKDSLRRPDGPHSNNPAVRAAVLERHEPQHTAWALQRPDGGRGFGFTGGHFHWGWGHPEFRQLILNAICWSAHVEVPKEGVSSADLSLEDLMKNQDFPVPDDFNPAPIEAQLNAW